MKIKKIPMRTCVITREKCEKKDLIRVVRTPEQEVKVDETGKMNGKGAYLKKDKEVIKKAKQNKILEKISSQEDKQKKLLVEFKKLENKFNKASLIRNEVGQMGRAISKYMLSGISNIASVNFSCHLVLSLLKLTSFITSESLFSNFTFLCFI